MKTITLTKGYQTIVDDEDYEFLMQWKWHVCFNSSGHVYAMRNSSPICGKRHHIMMHRIVNNTPDGLDTDHVNGDGLDNRRGNIRTATRAQNMWNRKPNVNGTSAHKGVYWHRQHQKWCVSISVNNRSIHLGLFDDESTAAIAYKRAAYRYFGAFNMESSRG